MNLANKLTVSRIIMTILIIVLLLFPFYEIGINFPKYTIDGDIVVDLKFLIAGVLFIIASLTDFLDGYIARKYKMVTDTGKVLDAIGDKILVNSTLIIFAFVGMIDLILSFLIVLNNIL